MGKCTNIYHVSFTWCVIRQSHMTTMLALNRVDVWARSFVNHDAEAPRYGSSVREVNLRLILKSPS